MKIAVYLLNMKIPSYFVNVLFLILLPIDLLFHQINFCFISDIGSHLLTIVIISIILTNMTYSFIFCYSFKTKLPLKCTSFI